MSTDTEAKLVPIPFLDRIHASIESDACMFEEKIRHEAAPVVSAIHILEKEARCAERAIASLEKILDAQRRDIYPDNDVRDVLSELGRKHVAIIPAWDINKDDDDVHVTMFLALISDVDYQREGKMRIDVFNAMLCIDGSRDPTHSPHFSVQQTRIDFGVALERAVASEHTVAVDAMKKAQQGLISPLFDTAAHLQSAWENKTVTLTAVGDEWLFTAKIRVCLLVAVSTDHTRY